MMPREQVLAQESIDYPLPTLSCAASAYTHTRPLRYPPNELPRPVHKRLRRVDGLRCPPRRVDAVARLHRDQVGAEPPRALTVSKASRDSSFLLVSTIHGKCSSLTTSTTTDGTRCGQLPLRPRAPLGNLSEILSSDRAILQGPRAGAISPFLNKNP